MEVSLSTEAEEEEEDALTACLLDEYDNDDGLRVVSIDTAWYDGVCPHQRLVQFLPTAEGIPEVVDPKSPKDANLPRRRYM